ncbi:MAG TPA: FAD-dependent oxidoreductase [Polyangiaceae bacterium]|jgi:2-polyprenyl-6-methoxyphenol hydroxylase-like FAD-dependent oxidoreductase
MENHSIDVLVVGAGPTGLFLALLLAKLGVSVRVVDAAEGPGTTSRALAVQARTLEFYRQVGLVDEVLERGLVFGDVNLWRGGERVAHVDLSNLGEGISPYPFGLIFPQDQHERLLIERLEREGVKVERRVTVHELEDRGGSVIVRATAPDGERTYEAKLVAGCDGARSAVRKAIGVGFPGGTYEHVFYVADILAEGGPMDKGLHVMLDEAGFLALFPLAADGAARLIGTVRVPADQTERQLGWDDIDRGPVDRIGLRVTRVNWFSTYRVHHRVADSFRRGNVFLLGDAGHIHSPVGGQGMNTGLGDAMNLAWKMAAVLGGRARADLLDTYEPERIAFARRLVATTDRAFQAASSDTTLARFTRFDVLPRILPLAVRTGIGRRTLFATVSQTAISYRDSAWSEGRAGEIHAGDRLPWVAPEIAGGDDNFTPLASLDWQAHVYGSAPPGARETCESHRVTLHVFPWTSRVDAASLSRDVMYLVRPDGYIGGVFTDPARLEGYLASHEIRVRV